ncbi:hypothetical protein ACEWY4_025121 [Coilia grayii]|uniref:Coronin n=1 Tax=Coilia grayii TaxID=363190 RepID=A0ABD1IX02_9TELE
MFHLSIGQMSWQPPYHSSKFRHVFPKPASRENCYTGLPITSSVHDNAFCAVNPRFIAVVTECAGGGAFLVISIYHKGRVDPQHSRVCGHQGAVLDVRWDPFSDLRIASCSEDCTVKVWTIPPQGLRENLARPVKDLRGHTRRVGLIEWHPVAKDILLSSAYDCKVLIWRLDVAGCVCRRPVRVIGVHSDLVLCLSFNTDGSRVATTCRDRTIRIIHTHTGQVLQRSSVGPHRPCKVVFASDLQLLVTTGASYWNQRQIAVWDTEDLRTPLLQEDLDGESGVLFPFYDPDTHMMFLAGKGDGNTRIFDLSSDSPYLHYLAEYRSPLPQRSMGPLLMSLRPGTEIQNPYPAPDAVSRPDPSRESFPPLTRFQPMEAHFPDPPANRKAAYLYDVSDLSEWQEDDTHPLNMTQAMQPHSLTWSATQPAHTHTHTNTHTHARAQVLATANARLTHTPPVHTHATAVHTRTVLAQTPPPGLNGFSVGTTLSRPHSPYTGPHVGTTIPQPHSPYTGPHVGTTIPQPHSPYAGPHVGTTIPQPHSPYAGPHVGITIPRPHSPYTGLQMMGTANAQVHSGPQVRDTLSRPHSPYAGPHVGTTIPQPHSPYADPYVRDTLPRPQSPYTGLQMMGTANAQVHSGPHVGLHTPPPPPPPPPPPAPSPLAWCESPVYTPPRTDDELLYCTGPGMYFATQRMRFLEQDGVLSTAALGQIPRSPSNTHPGQVHSPRTSC